MRGHASKTGVCGAIDSGEKQFRMCASMKSITVDHRLWWVVQLGIENAADIALLKVQSSQTLEFCAREAMQILGGAAYMRGNRVERIYREVRVNAIGGGSEEIMKDLAARQYGV